MSRALVTRPLKLDRKSLRGRSWSRIDLLCEQDRWWVDARGRIHDVDKIDVDYVANLIAFLEANAARLRRFWIIELLYFGARSLNPYGDDVDFHEEDERYRELARLVDSKPDAWIRQQPLYAYLVDRLASLRQRPGSQWVKRGDDVKVPSTGELVHAGSAEERFKKAVRLIHEWGFKPTPLAIKRELDDLDPRGQRNLLNGRECKWRREVLAELGYTLDPVTYRYRAPGC